MRLKNLLVMVVCLAVCTVCVLADTLHLKDGTTLEGKIIEQPDRYWVKLADGSGTKTVLKKDVASIEKGDAKPKPAAPATPTPAAPTAGAGAAVPAPKGGTGQVAGSTPAGSVTAGTSPAFLAVKSKADHVEAPVM